MKSLAKNSAARWTGAGAALVLLGLLAGGFLQARKHARKVEGWPPLPEAVPARCEEETHYAAHAAHAALAAGRARMQRYAFAPRDARIALERFAQAAECARAAGNGALAATASQHLASVHARVDQDARDHFRRYQHLKERGRLAEAAPDIAFLLDLGWPERGSLADSLRRDSAAVAADAVGARP